MARGDGHALLQNRARRKHGARAEAAALKHGRAHPNQGPLLDDAAFELRGVADAGVALDHCRQVFRAVDDRVVLDVAPSPTLIVASSPLSTAPNQTLAPASTSTSPMRTAVGAM